MLQFRPRRPRLAPLLWPTALLWLIALPTPASYGAGYEDGLPAGRLGVVVATDFARAESLIARTAADLGLAYRSPVETLGLPRDTANTIFGSGEVAVGAAVSDATGAVYPFASLAVDPTADDPLATFLAAVGGEPAGDVGLLTVSGVELCVAITRGRLLVVPVEQLDEIQQPNEARGVADLANPATQPPATELRATGSQPLLAFEVERRGLTMLAERAGRIEPHVRKAALGRALVWPPTVAALKAQFVQNRPLLEELALAYQRIRFELHGDDGGIAARFVASQPTSAKRQPPRADAEARRVPPAPFAWPRPAASASGTSDGGAVKALLRLNLAYLHGRPDAIDADAYDERAMVRFRAAALAALGHVESFDASIAAHLQADEPLYANRAAVLQVRDADAFGAAVIAFFDRWNTLVAETMAGANLTFATRPLERDGLQGVEFDVDILAAMNLGAAPEVRDVIERFFGPGARYTWRLVTLPDGRVLLSDYRWPEVKGLAKRLADAKTNPYEPRAGKPEGAASLPSAPGVHATVAPLRYLGWQQRITRTIRGQAERHPAEAAQTPPVRLSATVSAGQLRVEAFTPRPTLRAIGRGYAPAR
ncbi:MAG: hypothetical protein AAGB00_08795 [Planctomycetota bacterium]